MSDKTPYSNLPKRQFWRTAVAEPGPLGLSDLHRPDFSIGPDDKIITAGSCFAQALSRALLKRGFAWLDAEPPPPMMRPETAREFNYGVFSARTGNIYSVALLRQWLEWALEPEKADREVWPDNRGGFLDPLRPALEPEPFVSEAELFAARARTFEALLRAVRDARIFIFTLGLTEVWHNIETGMVYPMCPGTQGGVFDPDRHAMTNQFCDVIMSDFEAVLGMLSGLNPDLRIILTVSPVSLTATAEPDCHALVANTYTKSTLRAVAGEAARRWAQVDYFPSYELVATPPMRGMFYAPNQRTIAPLGIDFVMKAFFDTYVTGHPADRLQPDELDVEQTDELVCSEKILEFYNDR